ncbi:hypothetical protein O181_050002 [Austropuccinia psidii MF-1]|uniref:Uncharacterized protein n=1 Tax=Austropuccinia psidii MF-1 TaxID=1389203 RepID=A0A9Q3E2T9_9BASI|nr:hypothetical protein [Austropuccinia psidii MF-1]
MRRNWNNVSESLTQSNYFPDASERDENLGSTQIFYNLRRERNLNQRISGSNPSHREILAYVRANMIQEHQGMEEVILYSPQQSSSYRTQTFKESVFRPLK